MKKLFFIILSFTGIIPVVLSVNRQYHLIQQARNWTDAQAYCRANFDDLATIETNDDIINLKNLVQSQQTGYSAWIGLYTESSGWHWSLGNEPLGTETRWASGQPKNGNDECAITTATSGWWGILCTETKPFTCFDDRNTGNSRYFLINSPMSWYDAQSYCRQYHTDMASARTSTENSIILQLIAGSPLYSWLGLYRTPWKWSDKSNMSTMPWITGNPDDALGNENCGYIYNGQTADAQCSNIMPFFCHKIMYPREQQTIKVKVRSNQDVNDPVVKEAILEKVKQKLQDHGMANNTTVNWREQPDGVVFQKEKQTTT